MLHTAGNATEKIDLGQLNTVLWEFTRNVVNLPWWSHGKVIVKSGGRTSALVMESSKLRGNLEDFFVEE